MFWDLLYKSLISTFIILRNVSTWIKMSHLLRKEIKKAILMALIIVQFELFFEFLWSFEGFIWTMDVFRT